MKSAEAISVGAIEIAYALLTMTKAERGRMPRRLNKRSYVSQPPGGRLSRIITL